MSKMITTKEVPNKYADRKFNISAKMSELPEKVAKEAKRNPLEHIKVRNGTLKRDMSIRKGELDDIPVTRMAVYAAFFKCKIEDLIG